MSELSGNESSTDMRALLARVPAVERVLSSAAAQPLIGDYGRTQVVDAFRAAADALRALLHEAAR